MEKDEVIGLYKILSKGEEVIFQGNGLTPILQVKENYIKKVLNREERVDIPIVMYQGRLYLTTKRLIFLVLQQIYSQDYGKEEMQFGGIEGTWTEVPVDAITDYQIRTLPIKKSMWKGFFDGIKEISASKYLTPNSHDEIESVLEIIYDEKRASGRSLEYAEGVIKRGWWSKRFGKIENISDKLLILGNDAISMSPSLSQFTKDKEIKSEDKEIKSEDKEIKSEDIAEGDFFCTKCGAKQSKSDSNFCSKCGNQLQFM